MLEAMRSRLVFRALDALLTCEADGVRAPDAAMPTVGPNYRRVRGLAGSLARRSPGALRALQDRILEPNLIPLRSNRVSLAGYGSGWTVFLVPTPWGDDPAIPTVLKVRRKSIGQNPDVLHGLATTYRARYERVAGWYENWELTLPAHFVILHGPLMAERAMACLQPYVPPPHRDAFLDVAPREMLTLLERHEFLRGQLLGITGRTLETVEREGQCIDLVGRGNLQLVRSSAGPRLCLIDNGVFDLALKQRTAPEAVEALTFRLRYLERLGRSIER